MSTMDDFIADTRANYPAPGDNPVSHLAHTVALFSGMSDDDMVVMASWGVWGGGQTGLTIGDLRALLTMVQDK